MVWSHAPDISLPRRPSGILDIGPGTLLRTCRAGMLGKSGVIVVCSGWCWGKAARGPGRSQQRTWDFAARGR